ncbi:proto-oncogene tyrosine-protein kinase receptor Ret-like [Stylophora pistillata]|uniref:proto-oncogene tyrosine-protein kinase receptor Ret-like n=1 Tax=Stylophora pistillata TaxID=50429 RepID=UPI000C04EBD6|nr:proto-oncogene tyrosine-protein kinase receptor Ret-like [Stylophora pistillata]
MAASFHGSYSEVLSRIPPKDPANISDYNISFKGKLIENVKASSCYETAVKFSLIAETSNASNTDRTGCMYLCNESYYRPSNVTDCEGVTGIFYGAVIGSTATAVVGAGILLFFVCKLRKRNSKNSNGKRERTNRETTAEIGLVDTWLEMTEPSQSQQCMALDERNRSSPITNAEQASLLQPSEPVDDYSSFYSPPRCWEIPIELVTLEKVIGKGAFGQVAKAEVRGLQGRPRTTLVAVKMLKEHASELDRKELLSELQLMKELDAHPHVIKLLGCVTRSGPLMVLIEYVPYGDLLGYLRKSRGLKDTYFQDPDIKPKTNLTSKQLMKYAWQVADGMSYLSSIPIIHRDIAARNVLVGEGETCKVTDFGMARDVQEDNIYQMRSKGRIPLKWTAFEALLHGKYSTKSDVWSYGVLLYEIVTIGGSPYPEMDGRQILTLLNSGYRMPKPQHVDDKLYDIMTNCWEDDPELRPSFESLRNELKEMEDQHKGLINLDNYDDRLYVNADDLVMQSFEFS